MTTTANQTTTTGTVQHLNPDTLARNPAFTQAIVVTGAPKTIYIGGQDAVDASGAIIGSDLKTQTEPAHFHELSSRSAQTLRDLAKASFAFSVQVGVHCRWEVPRRAAPDDGMTGEGRELHQRPASTYSQHAVDGPSVRVKR